MSTATLAGQTVTHARVHIPAWGVSWVEAAIDTDEVPISGAAVFKMADLTIAGTIMSGGTGPAGRARYRLAAGAGSWGKTVAEKSYANDAGIKASTVLGEAAKDCGETIDAATFPDTRLGPAYAREKAPASRVLETVAPGRWYVGEDGITRIGKRPQTVLPPDVQIASIDRAFGTVEMSADSVAGLLPGVLVENLEAVDILHELSPGKIRTTLWAAGISPSSRRLSSLRRIIEQIDPRRRYRGVYEYRVVTQESERLNLQPIRVSTGMPTLQRVFVRPGVSGARADVALGSRVIVSFLDGEPARPIVVGFEDADGEGFLPTILELNASTQVGLGPGPARLAVARQTDPVIAGPFGGTITAGSTRVSSG